MHLDCGSGGVHDTATDDSDMSVDCLSVCVCVTGQQRDDVTDDVTESEEVVVSEEDFYAALSSLTPSLSAAELNRYDELQKMFTLHPHHTSSSSSSQF